MACMHQIGGNFVYCTEQFVLVLLQISHNESSGIKAYLREMLFVYFELRIFIQLYYSRIILENNVIMNKK